MKLHRFIPRVIAIAIVLVINKPNIFIFFKFRLFVVFKIDDVIYIYIYVYITIQWNGFVFLFDVLVYRPIFVLRFGSALMLNITMTELIS